MAGTDPTIDRALPKVFGRYLLLRRLSRGGMGEVFLAKSGQLTGFEKVCVIKKILPNLAEDREFIRRFIDEAQVAVQLTHANIASVFEVGMVEGEYFLALEYVEGRDLRAILARLHERRERLPPDLALWVVREVASGLGYAHRRTDDKGRPMKLVHCDISPPNVLVSFEGEVKIIDFGISKSRTRISVSNPRVGFGKIGYMAPEQLLRGGEVDRRADVYAAGVLLHEMLTGERLVQFPEGTDYRTIARHVTLGDHPPPSRTDPALGQFDAIVARAIAPDPMQRYGNAEELRDAVQLALARISPTLTADRFGAYVRRLFADEAAMERSFLLQATQADLAPWVDELTGIKTHTVSFALSEGLTGPGAERPDVKTDPAMRSSGRRRATIAGASVALALVAAVLAVAWIGRPRTPRGQQTPAVVVAPMKAPAAAVDVVPAPAPARPAPTKRVLVKTEDRPASSEAKPLEPPAGDEDARDEELRAVRAKFERVQREYVAFKKAYGPRFDADWSDLAELMTFGSRAEMLARSGPAIDRLRQRMAEVRRGSP